MAVVSWLPKTSLSEEMNRTGLASHGVHSQSAHPAAVCHSFLLAWSSQGACCPRQGARLDQDCSGRVTRNCPFELSRHGPSPHARMMKSRDCREEAIHCRH